MGRIGLEKFVEKNKVTIDSVFIPYSQSRHAKDTPPWPSLNWRVTLKRDGRDVISTEYAAGTWHCPASKAVIKDKYEWRLRIECEIESGRKSYPGIHNDHVSSLGGAPLLPDICDVLSSLALDGSAINDDGFADWASNLGYDTDSIKARDIYQTCLDTGLKLRAAFGEAGFGELQTAVQDY
jgi:hypothetical protein